MELPDTLDRGSFSFKDLTGTDRWISFTPAFNLTVVGTPTYTGRLRVIGKQCQAQVILVSTTSIASVAGTNYLTLPIPAKGYSGMGVLSNDTSNIAIGLCHIDVATSRCYLPTQTASGNTFTIYCEYEIG